MNLEPGKTRPLEDLRQNEGHNAQIWTAVRRRAGTPTSRFDDPRSPLDRRHDGGLRGGRARSAAAWPFSTQRCSRQDQLAAEPGRVRWEYTPGEPGG